MTVVHEVCWTPRLAAAQLVEAADTLRRPPERCGNGYWSTWPPINEDCCVDSMLARTKVRSASPSAAVIDRMDAALLRLKWLNYRDQQLSDAEPAAAPGKLSLARTQSSERQRGGNGPVR